MKTSLLLLFLTLLGTAYAQSPSFVWSAAAGGTNLDDGNSVATDANGNVFVTGYFQSPTITFGNTTLTNAGGFDFYIVKYDAAGNVLWAKSAGGAKDDIGNSLSTDQNGNVFVTGLFYSNTITFGTTTLINAGINADDIFIVKYDANGNVSWAKREGNYYYEYGKSIATDPNGDVIVTGCFSSDSITFGNTTLMNTSSFSWDIFVTKYTANGILLWAKSIGGATGEFAGEVSTDASGNVYATGYFYSPTLVFGSTSVNNTLSNFSDIYLVKYDVNGTVKWAKGVGGADEDFGNSITNDAAGNILVAGAFKSPSITFGSTTLTNAGNSSYDVLVAKYDAMGNALWAKGSGGTGSEFCYGISTDVNGNVCATGCFYSQNISFGIFSLTNANTGLNESDIFLVNYDANGDEQWTTGIGGTDQDVAFGVDYDPVGNIAITGHFHSPTIVFGSTTLTTSGGSVFTAKLGGTTGIDEAHGSSGITISPNPFSTHTTLQLSNPLNNAVFSIYNSAGQRILEILNISGTRFSFSREKLEAGIYFVRLEEDDKIIAMEKMIVME